MRTRSQGRPEEPIDPEIEASCRQRNAHRNRMAAQLTPEQIMLQLQEQLHQMQQQLADQEAARQRAEGVPIRDMFAHGGVRGPPVGPRIDANNFELKPALISMVQQNQYGGRATEDPNVHLAQFLEISNTVKINGVQDDTIRMRLFPFSLRDKAKQWYQSLGAGSVSSWEQIVHKFLNKFFPPGMTLKLKSEITQFRQKDQESLYDAWERLRDMLRKCPNHGFDEDHQVCIFYHGCDLEVKRLLDAAAGGSLLNKGHEAAIRVIEDMATTSYEWPGERQVQIMKRVASTSEPDAMGLVVQQLVALNAKIEGMTTHKAEPTEPQPLIEDVNYVNQGAQRGFNNYRTQQGGGNNYSGYHTHPNLSYGNLHNAIQPPPDFLCQME